MFRVKSFKLSDDKGANELTSKYPLAQGASILVSNGEMVLPYEDCEPEPNEVIVARIKEQKNRHDAQLRDLTHSQMVLERAIKHDEEVMEQISADLAEADKQPNKKGKSDAISYLKSRLDAVKNMLSQRRSQHLLNHAEITRININIDVFNETIAKYEKV